MIKNKIIVVLVFGILFASYFYLDDAPSIYFYVKNGTEFKGEDINLKISSDFYFIENDNESSSYLLVSRSLNKNTPIVVFLEGKFDFDELEKKNLIVFEKEILKNCYLYSSPSSDEFLIKDTKHNVFFSITREYTDAKSLQTVCGTIEVDKN
ncbi:hypothetical protein [Thalassotalea piscium]|uniref:Uncharacterized protein n=1 Tax=Thalassotalea piscium TaxID=1230533 RepID=A0A7X0NKF7_9GAMM|nr:hypothetical protein [Thalassotalea piscium]MBB6545094.1 hypothetical protein [Thalassotalea piscium]